ncbi:RNA-directed DNA polymerase, eukaryota [Tanacetum coccineum]
MPTPSRRYARPGVEPMQISDLRETEYLPHSVLVLLEDHRQKRHQVLLSAYDEVARVTYVPSAHLNLPNYSANTLSETASSYNSAITCSYSETSDGQDSKSGLDWFVPARSATNSSIPFPPGFTPDKPDTDVDKLVAQKDQFQPDVKSVGSSSHTVESANNVDDQFSTGSIENIQKKKESGSILEILEEMISVGQTMGFSMEGSIKDMERIIDLKGADDHETKAEKVSDMEIKSLWGNTNFDAIVSQSLDHGKGIVIPGLTPRHLNEHSLGSSADPSRELYTDYRANPVSFVHSDQLGANDDLLSVRSELLKQYHDIHSVETRESIQKAKIKWAVEGDENSKFFHGMINRKRANLAVKGVMIDGEWVDDPSKVKDEFRDYFASRFCDPGIRHGVINFNFPNRLNIDQSGVEAPISRDEILGPDLCLAVEWFFHHASFPVGCNSSFIALIPKTLNPKSVAFLPNRQILDGPFIINELLARCHHKKHSAMVFKIDFAKAYDSIRWDYLGDVLKSFGFGVKWCSWIRGILNSSMASILVNGSPTKEFQFHRGLKQGDPLAPYLFIIIMESLHLSFSRVIEAGIFTGIKIDSSMTLSHLFYADDAVFIGEWSRGNLTGIMHTLRCFSLLPPLH